MKKFIIFIMLMWSSISYGEFIDIYNAKEVALEALKKDGMDIGKSIWPRQPMKIYNRYYPQSPSLSKLTILDVDVIDENRSLDKMDIGIYLLVRNDKNEDIYILIHENHLDANKSVSHKFYLTDPKKIIASWGPKIMNAVHNNEIIRGMTAAQVKASWGNPKEINSSVGSWGRNEQWIYGNPPKYNYIYMKNGKLDAWQN